MKNVQVRRRPSREEQMRVARNFQFQRSCPRHQNFRKPLSAREYLPRNHPNASSDGPPRSYILGPNSEKKESRQCPLNHARSWSHRLCMPRPCEALASAHSSQKSLYLAFQSPSSQNFRHTSKRLSDYPAAHRHHLLFPRSGNLAPQQALTCLPTPRVSIPLPRGT